MSSSPSHFLPPGLTPARDHALTAPLPEDPSAFETMNLWLYDAEHRLGLNMHAIMHGGKMDTLVSVFLPDGGVLRAKDEPAVFTEGQAPHSAKVFYRCEEPFQRWRYRVEALPMFLIEPGEQTRTYIPGTRQPGKSVSLELTGSTLSQPWVMGTLLPEARQAMLGSAGLWIGGRLTSGMSPLSCRYEQALSVSGQIVIDGKPLEFEGRGIRGHVRGSRSMDGMNGHTWIAGAFPSGRAFGALCFPRAEGGYHLSEAYLWRDGRLIPNRIIYAPPLTRDPGRQNYVLELACDELGLTRIAVRIENTLWWGMPSWSGDRGKWDGYGFDASAPIIMCQAMATFRWDGEPGAGLDERSG